jgi:predicted ABC-type sugar transport system permease subunit
MNADIVLAGLAGVLNAAGPVVFAAVGETITERAGIINLSMNGTILLSAMGGFAVALVTGSAPLGFLAGAAIGALVALVVAFASIALRQSQVAVGFVLALLCRDLSYFLGNPIMGMTAPRLTTVPIPLLSGIPVIGPLLFKHDAMTYASFALIAVAWLYINRTRPGLLLRGIGEKPAAAYARGVKVNRLRYAYAALGGAIAGLAGPVDQGRLERHYFGLGRHRLDSLGDHDLRRLGPDSLRGGRLPIRPPAVAGASPAAEPSRRALAGSPGRALPPDDPDPPRREHRQGGVGGEEPGGPARADPALPGQAFPRDGHAAAGGSRGDLR